MDIDLETISAERPVLIAGPTASGKSALALAIAERRGGVIVNADALQVFANWRILTARPGRAEEEAAPHALYGHVPGDAHYSVGHWLRDLAPLLGTKQRPIIVGGTGLNFTALTEGLAQIPETPPEIRRRGEVVLREQGLQALIEGLDARSRARIDTQNPARVARAWEVLQATGRALADWQDETGPALLPRDEAHALVLMPDRDWLRERMERRFDAMLAAGALEEVRANLPNWDPALPSSKAIGAAQLVAHLQGEIGLEAARERAIIATRQYAKRQRSWLRARMGDWQPVVPG